VGNESCCTSLAVPGGTYNRGNDGTYPATIATFALDKYEITVGRFRKFVEAGKGTQASPPGDGAGAHPLIAGSGWQASAWNSSLATNTAALTAAVKCNSTYQSWTDAAAGNENRPMTCVSWFDAFAFCAWDGGRLATEAEWNYAAAGGSEQRLYPWGSTAPDDTYAVFCGGSCSTTQNVGGKSPKGNGKWGHADLAGNVWEWNLDWHGNYPLPCSNCAVIAAASYRVYRGGSFLDSAYLASSTRNYNASTLRSYGIGSRCARTVP
jgi:formylglycine-generating enzyme required for sulfatase activity